MAKKHMIAVDELATFMNIGWPGEDWYLADHAELLWETAFATGNGDGAYRAQRPGTMIDLDDFEARVRWQGTGRDPTGGRGHKLSELFLRWQRTREEAVLVAYVPREKLTEIAAALELAGCLLVAAN
ncbi:MAG TPA: hypothetical protein VL486_11200 [Verrucomicrobiae bacterium]|nr:hypothetical protein [Verrucomicrobiae bacterium]